MHKIINKRFGKKVLIVGGILLILTILASFIILSNVYGIAGSAFDTNNPNVNQAKGLGMWATFSKINLIAQKASYLLVLAGLIIMALSHFKAARK